MSIPPAASADSWLLDARGRFPFPQSLPFFFLIFGDGVYVTLARESVASFLLVFNGAVHSFGHQRQQLVLARSSLWKNVSYCPHLIAHDGSGSLEHSRVCSVTRGYFLYKPDNFIIRGPASWQPEIVPVLRTRPYATFETTSG